MKLFSRALLKELSNGTRRCRALYLRAHRGNPKPKPLRRSESTLPDVIPPLPYLAREYTAGQVGKAHKKSPEGLFK